MLNKLFLQWYDSREIWTLEPQHSTVPSPPEPAPGHSALLLVVNCAAHTGLPPEFSLDWLSATSESNNQRVLGQRKGWVKVCLCRSIADLSICSLTEQQPLDVTAGTGMHLYVYMSILRLTDHLQHNRGTTTGCWSNDKVEQSIPHSTDYLQYHRATATGHYYSNDKAELWTACTEVFITWLTIWSITEQQPLGITAMTRLNYGLLVQEYSSLDWLSAASQSNSHWALQHRQGQVMVYTLVFLTWLILCSITKQQSLGITPKTRLRLGTHWPWVFLTEYLQNLRAKPLEQGWVRVYV